MEKRKSKAIRFSVTFSLSLTLTVRHRSPGVTASRSDRARRTASRIDLTRSQQQQCQSVEGLAEWRSSEQMENGTPSTSPSYWDSDSDDDNGLGMYTMCKELMGILLDSRRI